MSAPPLFSAGAKVRLIRCDGLNSPHQQAQAHALLLQPQHVGKVGEVYFEPSTQQWHARVYWKVNGVWYAVNLPTTHFEQV